MRRASPSVPRIPPEPSPRPSDRGAGRWSMHCSRFSVDSRLRRAASSALRRPGDSRLQQRGRGHGVLTPAGTCRPRPDGRPPARRSRSAERSQRGPGDHFRLGPIRARQRSRDRRTQRMEPRDGRASDARRARRPQGPPPRIADGLSPGARAIRIWSRMVDHAVQLRAAPILGAGWDSTVRRIERPCADDRDAAQPERSAVMEIPSRDRRW